MQFMNEEKSFKLDLCKQSTENSLWNQGFIWLLYLYYEKDPTSNIKGKKKKEVKCDMF